MDEMNIKTPFLEQVAHHYYQQKQELIDYCFIFPNRRSGEFFLLQLAKQQHDVPLLSPQITTITDFATTLTQSILASPIEQIFTLYQAYVEITGNDQYSFDRFAFWGNVLLQDFNDVDTTMVDAKDLFVNVKQYREIGTDFLSPELKECFSKLFNVHFDDNDDEQFWKHITHSEDSTVRDNYVKLWQVLYPLYTLFRQRLGDKGLSYSGKIMRDAAAKISEMDAGDFHCKKYIFVGFNFLSKCEQTIFKQMQNKGIAEFCWDFDSPAFKEKTNLATRYLNEYTKKFPNSFATQSIDSFPEMTVVGVPFNMGQAKYAFKIVDDLAKNGDIQDTDNAIDTAIVLPDEGLFMPLLNSVAGDIKRINVTLGYPLRNSSIASLMRIVAKMHSQASRVVNESGDYEYGFYREDVKSVLTHPIIKSLYPHKSIELISEIDNNNLYQVPEHLFNGADFNQLFVTIRNTTDSQDVIEYLNRLMDFVATLNDKFAPNEEQASPGNDQDSAMPLQSAFLNKYYEVLEQVKLCITDYGVPMCESTVFYLIDRIASIYSIPFEGEPLAGLQLMGVLETRCLDFTNIILLSMNERIFPRRFYKASFIPFKLRKHFDMPTMEHQESMMAYYFYRLISRANKVYMLYDSSSQSLGSGEYSRFITQLKNIYQCPIHHILLTPNIAPGSSLKIDVKKQGRIADTINAFQNDDLKSHLSASSIKEYIACPLKFYFHQIEELNDDNDETDFIDAATFGSIVHDTLQQLYYPDKYKKGGKPYKVFRNMIVDFKKNDLDKFLVRNINKTYLHRKKDKLDTQLTGEMSILYEAFKHFALNVINYDLKLLNSDNDYFEVLECEIPHVTQIDLGDGFRFNFKFKADRIDRINGTGPIRIIDYKTGKDETNFTDFGKLYSDSESASKRRSILQLFLYCNAYANVLEENGVDNPGITPIIYKLKRMSESGIIFNSEVVLNYDGTYKGTELNESFKASMREKLKELFDLSLPFSQCSEKTKTCNYCKFIEFCRRNKKEYFNN